jgi:hypothetical protein
LIEDELALVVTWAIRQLDQGHRMSGILNYLCISPADDRMPLQNNKIVPVIAMNARKRVLVKNTHIARVGGNCPFADFQVRPLLGRSMVSSAFGWHAMTTP